VAPDQAATRSRPVDKEVERKRHPESFRSRSPLMLLLSFATLTALVLLATLPVSCVSGYRFGYAMATLTGSGSAYPVVRPQTIQPLGARPAHLRTDPVNQVPNQQAITTALWAPGIDHGYVPQGLTFAEGQILMSGYQHQARRSSWGPAGYTG
jgi:hypothetical protein